MIPARRVEKPNEEGEPGVVYETRLPWDAPGPLAEVVKAMTGLEHPAPWQPHVFAIPVTRNDRSTSSFAGLWVPKGRLEEAEALLLSLNITIEQ